jgi:chemotaxis protein CheX
MNSIYEFDIFNKAIQEYFVRITYEPCSVGNGFMIFDKPVILQYTGIIYLSGLKKGVIYFTADLKMLHELAQLILGTKTVARDVVISLTGEITNTISGNTRQKYGSKLEISLPQVLAKREAAKRLAFYLPAYIIPIHWQSHHSYLTIYLE